MLLRPLDLRLLNIQKHGIQKQLIYFYPVWDHSASDFQHKGI